MTNNEVSSPLRNWSQLALQSVFFFFFQIRFLRDAVKVLIRSRRTLTYTFVFAYFLQKNNHVEIFEDNQSDLESAVERLSGFLEAEITNENVVELKKNIQDSYKYCEQRCNVLMEHIREGEEKSLWQMH